MSGICPLTARINQPVERGDKGSKELKIGEWRVGDGEVGKDEKGGGK